jgi:multidrug efflux pump subunit AcrA (membrane-fusion protein)
VSEPATLTVPAGAVMAPSGRDPSVLRLRRNTVERVPIALGALYGKRIGVSGELHAGERVVTAGYTGLVEGERVEVLP